MVLYIISGFAQSGKTTLVNLLLKDPKIARIVTSTSRKPREGEVDKNDYYFLKEEDFKDLGKFIETALVHGNYYGTLKDEVKNKLKQEGKKVVWVMDVQGVANILKNHKDLDKDMVTIFITPEKFTTLIQRIRLKEDSNSGQRIESIRKELTYLSLFKYFINTSISLEESLEDLKGVIYGSKEKKLEILDFKPKESISSIRITFTRNDQVEQIVKQFYLKNPVEIVNSILLEIKKKDRMIVEDSNDILQNIYITRIENEEEIEEKLLYFFQGLCSKFAKIKSLTKEPDYMKLYDEIKTTKFIL